MAYIPKHKQKSNPPLQGGILVNPSLRTQESKDSVQDYRGNFYQGAQISSKAKPLDYIPSKEEHVKEVYTNQFITSKIVPTDLDYKRGHYTRYFIKDVGTGKIIETSEIKYNTEVSNPKLYRKTGKLQWLLKGIKEDTLINGYVYKGVRTRNTASIEEASKILTGLQDQLLKDPLEFVVD